MHRFQGKVKVRYKAFARLKRVLKFGWGWHYIRSNAKNLNVSNVLYFFPGYAIKAFIPYKPAYGDNFKQGTVVKTDASRKKVVLKDGEEIPYDYLVLATGTTGHFPCKLDLSMTNVSKVIEMYDGVFERVRR